MKKFFIYAGCWIFAIIVETLIESSAKITLGGIPTVLLYGTFFFIANRLSKLCKKKDESKNKNENRDTTKDSSSNTIHKFEDFDE